jgi:hypothetical protein
VVFLGLTLDRQGALLVFVRVAPFFAHIPHAFPHSFLTTAAADSTGIAAATLSAEIRYPLIAARIVSAS